MCVSFCGSEEHSDNSETIRKKESASVRASLDMSILSRDVSVRIVHAGGQEELYENVMPASQLLEKYPGMCVARPEVFKNPEGSLLWPDENLLPGQKYLMIPSSTARKLKHRHLVNVPGRRIAEVNRVARVRRRRPPEVMRNSEMEKSIVDANITWDLDKEIKDESFSSAKDFYASGEFPPTESSPKKSPKRQTPTRSPRQIIGQFQKQEPKQLPQPLRRGRRFRKPFAPPLSRLKTCHGVDWEPNLTSIQEISP
ncbi:hypothetical protein ACFE04_024633 [Oxalis oulophora]